MTTLLFILGIALCLALAANTQEYGFFQMVDRGILDPDETIGQQESGLIVSNIDYDANVHNADINTLGNLFWEELTDYQLSIEQDAAGESQPLDENGRAIPTKPAPPYTIALPLQGSGNAWGANFQAMAEMTNRMLAKTLQKFYRGDYRWMMRHMLGALFANANWAWHDPRYGDLTIKGLANNTAGEVYYIDTTGALAVDNHYYAQAAAIADATNPFPTLQTELLEHPANGGDVIAFVSTSQKAGAIGLGTFNSATLDSRVQPGANTDRLIGTLQGVILPRGSTLLGMTDDGVWIVEWPMLPSDYGIAIATEGRRPLGHRIPRIDSLRGFRARGDRNDFPYNEQQWNRLSGFGALNRVGAVVFRTGNGSYAVPTNYAMPMY